MRCSGWTLAWDGTGVAHGAVQRRRNPNIQRHDTAPDCTHGDVVPAAILVRRGWMDPTSRLLTDAVRPDSRGQQTIKQLSFDVVCLLDRKESE